MQKTKSTQSGFSELIRAYKNYSNFLENEVASNKELDQLMNDAYIFKRHLVYGKIGFLGSSFKYDYANDSTKISDRFKTREFQGFRIELGYTLQSNRYNYFGVNLSLNSTNNIDNLKSTTFKLETIDSSITSGNFSTSEEIKALSGSYDRFLRYDISLDYVRLLPLKNHSIKYSDNDKLLLSLNPYLLHKIYSDSDTLKPNTSLGFGVYAFNRENGSIMGGLFLQADDLFDVNTDESRSLSKKMVFGVVFKAAIKSFDPAK